MGNICWTMEKAREFQKNIYLFFIDYPKVFDYVDHNRLWKILKEMGLPEHLTCLQRNLDMDQEATVRIRHEQLTANWERSMQIGCILSPYLFNIYAKCIMQNARLDKAQAGIKTAWRNINNLRYADDNTVMAESKEKLKSFFMKVKEESEKADLKLNIQKIKITASSPITSWQIEVKKWKH